MERVWPDCYGKDNDFYAHRLMQYYDKKNLNDRSYILKLLRCHIAECHGAVGTAGVLCARSQGPGSVLCEFLLKLFRHLAFPQGLHQSLPDLRGGRGGIGCAGAGVGDN